MKKATIITESILLVIWLFCAPCFEGLTFTDYSFSSLCSACYYGCQSTIGAAIITDWVFRARHANDLKKATDRENNAMFLLSFFYFLVLTSICYTMTAWICSIKELLWQIDTLCIPFMAICLLIYVVGWVAEFFFLRALHERYKD